MAPDPEWVTAALVGDRRANQLLHAVDTSDGPAADRLLSALVTAEDWRMLGMLLESYQRSITKRLSPSRRGAAEALQAEVAMLAPGAEAPEAFSLWVYASADLTVDLMRELVPNRTVRVRGWVSAARMAFDGEQAGSTVRRRFFGET